jgi:hypothetical protein
VSNIDKRALREAAEKATPGDWKYSTFDCAITDDTSSLAIVRMDSSHLNDEQSALNGTFIAAANPDTVLALLDELEAAEKRIAELPGQKRLIGWRMADYTDETSDPALAKNWATAVDVLPIFEGDVNTKLSAAAAGKGEAL